MASGELIKGNVVRDFRTPSDLVFLNGPFLEADFSAHIRRDFMAFYGVNAKQVPVVVSVDAANSWATM